MLVFFKKVRKDYKTLVAKMVGNNGIVEATKANVVNLCDVGTILGLPCVLPMLESVNAFMKFAMAKYVFICDYNDYIVVVKICQVDLYKMYSDPTTSFRHENFLEFINVVTNTSCT
jgi:hypothetical protein